MDVLTFAPNGHPYFAPRRVLYRVVQQVGENLRDSRTVTLTFQTLGRLEQQPVALRGGSDKLNLVANDGRDVAPVHFQREAGLRVLGVVDKIPNESFHSAGFG